MKAAIAELKLPTSTQNGESVLTDEDDDFDYSSAGSGNDVWDFISDSELEDLGLDSGDLMDSTDGHEEEPFGLHWFAEKCSAVAARKDGLPSSTLQDQIMDILKSSRPEDELQSLLTDLVGFDDLDFVIELISHRKEIASFASFQEDYETQPTGNRLLTRAEREDALRRQDYAHKNASLAPTGFKEPQYPHVYRSYQAGNSLSYAGKRYALPQGSQRKEFEKYEEYSIPAGKAGGLLPGQKLVNIEDLDGLCRRTFKGYKALNRMQSLVYPVAYKTSENMLICAPTGAVSIIPVT
jgi:antiviral helicase SLH1